MNAIGNYIRKYRGNMSLRDFANKCGISHTHLDSIEKGIDPRSGKPVSVTIETLKKIASAMNMTINDLLIQSGDVKIDELQLNSDKIININNASREYKSENNSFDELEMLFSKSKPHLSKEKEEMMKFIMQQTIEEYEKNKNNQ